MDRFIRGDIVRLKSGGPDMVVYQHRLPSPRPKWWQLPMSDYSGVYVEWIDSLGCPHNQIYVPEVLVKVP